MATSIQRVVSDGSLVSLPLSIDYFDRTEISVYFDDILAADAAWDWVGLTDTTITFSPAVAVGVNVLVKRTTDTTAPRHVFSEGAQFNSSSLDDNTLQALRAAQEMQEGSGVKEIFNDINMHGKRIKVLGAAIDPGDAIPLGQYLADTEGAKAALLAAQALYDAFDDRYLGAKASDPALDNDGNTIGVGALYYNTVVGELRAFNGVSWQIGVGSSLNSKLFSGTGAQVNFTLDSIPSNENNTQVYVNGVYQQKDTYSLVGAVVTFSEAPPVGTNNIEVMTVVTLALGTVAAGNTSYAPTDGVTETNVQSILARFGAWIKAVASGIGATLIGYTPNNSAPTTVAHMLEAYSTDGGGSPSGSPSYAAVTVNKVRTTINIHAFEDWSVLNTTDSNLGYASYDAKPTMVNSLNQEHFVGFQSRPTYNGSGNLTAYMDSLNSAAMHNGTGIVTNASGVKILDIGGTGPVLNSYGIFIAAILRGSNTNYSIYAQGGLAHFGGDVELGAIKAVAGDGRLGVAYGPDVSTKNITYGYSVGGTANFGEHIWYDGKNGLAMQLQSTGLLIQKQILALQEIYSNRAMRPGVFTYATLPVGNAGELIYVSDGRKVGQGAGAGTGVMCYYSAGGWRVFSTDAIVTV